MIIMRVAIVDVQGFQLQNEFIVKEMAIRIDNQLSHFLFKPKIPYRDLMDNEKRTVKYIERNIHGLRYSNGYVSYTEIDDILWNHLHNIDSILTSGHQKYNFLNMKLNELKLNRVELKNIEHSSNYIKMEIGMPACLNHERGHFRCAINCVNIMYSKYKTSY